MNLTYESFAQELIERMQGDPTMPYSQVNKFLEEEKGRPVLVLDDFPGPGGTSKIDLKNMYDNVTHQETNVEEAVDMIRCFMQNVENSGMFKGCAINDDYEQIRDMLCLYPLSMMAEGVKEAVHSMVGDIALVLYGKITENAKCSFSVKIPEKYVEIWGVSKEKVISDALENTACLYEPRIFFLEDLLQQEQPRFDLVGRPFLNLSPKEMEENLPRRDIRSGLCLSTSEMGHGALAAFLPQVGKKLSEYFHGDYYLVFTSVHEAMVHGVDEIEPELLSEVLFDTVREATSKEDFLTLHVYRYNSEKEEIEIYI